MPLFSANLVALCWLVMSSLAIYPHSLSYFNESIGGPLNGPKHLLGSSVDWNQDLLYLKWRLHSALGTKQSIDVVEPVDFSASYRVLFGNSGNYWTDKSGKSMVSRSFYTRDST